ncbi:MAG: Flp family type IVb pilin [Stellaceae bacterium]
MGSRCLGLWVRIYLTAETVHQVIKDCRGVTAVEYALIAALIAVAAILSFTLLGTHLSSTFSNVAAKL